jgi:hypothetical protein
VTALVYTSCTGHPACRGGVDFVKDRDVEREPTSLVTSHNVNDGTFGFIRS